MNCPFTSSNVRQPTCSTEFQEWTILLLPSLIDLKRATMRREMIMMMCSTFKSDLFEATKKRIIKPIILLSKKVRHTPTVHKICIVNQLERKITPAQSL